MNKQQVIKQLKSMADPEKITLKEKKYGIKASNALGIYHKDLKELAKQIGKDDALAQELFDTGIYEARLLTSKIHSPKGVTEELMDYWTATFENWEICDSFCMGLYSKTPYAVDKAIEWSAHKDEFIKRAGFAIMAAYVLADKKADNPTYEQFFPIMIREASDERIYVKKAINWALRNIGKRNPDLQQTAIKTAKEILKIDNKAAQWIAKDALRELEKPNVSIRNYPRSVYG